MSKKSKAKDSKTKAGKAKAETRPGAKAEAPDQTADTSLSITESLSAPKSESDSDTPEKKPKSLSDRQITLISKALADPTRMAVLRSIAKGGATCGDLRTCTQISAATLSHHMKELETAGLIETERKGRFVNAFLQRKTWKSYVEELKGLSK